jgi:DNA-binding CsgD family transcriptional regulator
MFGEMYVILAAADADTRQRLRAKVLGAGLPCDEEVTAPSLLGKSLALREPEVPTVVVVAHEEDAELARLALGQGVPVLMWPVAGTRVGRRTASRPEHELGSPARGGAADGVSRRRLTAREREVLALVAAGISNKGIARNLRISTNTVKFHMTTLFGKLGVATRAEAIAAAARSGELSL